MAFIVGKSVLPRGTPAHRLGYAVEHEQCTTAARCASTHDRSACTGDARARDKALQDPLLDLGRLLAVCVCAA